MADEIPGNLDTLITSDVAKLPPTVAALIDPAAPLPAGVRFFEKRFEVADIIQRIFFTIGFGVAAIVLIPLGFFTLFDHRNITVATPLYYGPVIIGLVCAFVSWLSIASIASIWRMREKQLAGQSTRRGTFLTPGEFVQASIDDTTVIPRSSFVGLSGNSVKYLFKGQSKSFQLPGSLTDASSQKLHAAIAAWASGEAFVQNGRKTPPPLPTVNDP